MILELTSIITSGLLGVGLLLIFIYLLISQKTKHIIIFNQAFNKVIELEKTMLAEYRKSNSEDRIKWDGIFFNAVEHFCFMMNHGYFKDTTLYWFFSQSITHWYEDIFLKHISKKMTGDETKYPELKKLYYYVKQQTTE